MSSLTLTPEERATLFALAARMEKRIRQWPLLRWFAVVSFALGLGLLSSQLIG